MISNKYTCDLPFTRGLLAAAVLFSAGQTGYAQETGGGFKLEEIIVTAQKREQSAMDVPIAIGTFTPADIRDTGAQSIMEMHHFVPGFEVKEGQVTQANLTIRGITSPNISTGGDPSVATFYDGAYVPRAATTVTFSDLERVEILKGPQGTLFGRNAAAGVVNIVPNSPQAETQGFISTRIGNLGLVRVEGMGNVALSDNLFLRVNALVNERDGFKDNLGSGGDPGGQDNQTVRVAMLWEITDRTDLQLSYDWDEIDQAAPQGIGVGPFALTPGDAFASRVANDVIDGGEARDMYSVTAKVNHEFDDQWSMKYIANYREFETRNRIDDDGTADPLRYIDTDNIEDSDIVYTELQVNFNSDSVNLVAGANYSQEDTFQEIPTTLSTGSIMSFMAGPSVLNLQELLDLPEGAHLWNPDIWAGFSASLNGGTPLPQTAEGYTTAIGRIRAGNEEVPPHFFAPSTAGDFYTESMFNTGDFTNYGIYADADFTVTPDLNIAVGIRYSVDEKDFTWNAPLSDYAQENPELGLFNIFIPQAEAEASDRWTKTTGRLVANYRLSADVMAFASVSTGYKAGGYDSLEPATAELPLDPEEITNFELGLKGDFFDQRLRAQVSYYDMTVDGAQRTVFGQRPGDTGSTFYLINGDIDNRGVEIVLDWLVTDTLKLGLLTYFADEEETFPDTFNDRGELVPGDKSTSTRRPQDNYTAKLDWSPAIPVGELNIHLDYIVTEDRLRGTPDFLDSFATVDGYGDDREILSARISWLSDGGDYEVAVWGRNLTDSELVTSISGLGLSTINTPLATIEDPRTYGVDLRYNF
ncbi:TonB-dependent receptor [Exilibacterium tricleocarpae]|uniref:TonB-dependent receptor n=1 Tax=Exilibacterium tricleocarpae TaxID=2591008 RepID=A0A545TV99_9GAMM|nr:TonB-dependent receptor [Exilibacterium tricleocarpae]TQV81142.1 TonB-dependent receptor [Exilibacterium tricleocarpae]